MDLADNDGTWRPIVVAQDVLVVGYRVDSSILEVSEPAVLLRRIDARDGSTLWQTELGPQAGSASVVRSDSTYVVTQGPGVEAIDRRTGANLWAVRYEAAPRLVSAANGIVGVVLPDGVINVRDLRSGRNRWTLDPGEWDLLRLEAAGESLYALGADSRSGGSSERVGVFDLGRPSAEPIWSQRSAASVTTLGVGGGLLVGRLGGFDLRAVQLSDGRTVRDDVTPPAGGTLVGDRYLVSEPLQGLVLRLRRIEAYSLDDGETPLWTVTLPTGSELSRLEAALDGAGVLAVSSSSAVLLDARTGNRLWSARVSQYDDAGRACTVLGTTGETVLERCGDASDQVLVAREVVPN